MRICAPAPRRRRENVQASSSRAECDRADRTVRDELRRVLWLPSPAQSLPGLSRSQRRQTEDAPPMPDQNLCGPPGKRRRLLRRLRPATVPVAEPTRPTLSRKVRHEHDREPRIDRRAGRRSICATGADQVALRWMWCDVVRPPTALPGVSAAVAVRTGVPPRRQKRTE